MSKYHKSCRSKRGISQLTAVLITIAIVIIGGSLIASIFVNNTQVISSNAQISAQSVNLVKDTDGNVAFTITIKNAGTKPITSLTVQLAAEQPLTAAVPTGGLEPGRSVSASSSPTGTYISGQTYIISLTAAFSGGSSAAQSTSVMCQGSGPISPTSTPVQTPSPSPTSTFTPAPSQSPNPTATPTPTPTPTPSPTPTPTPQSWLAGWQYRKSHTINPAAGAGTGYQLKITVYYGAGTDNAGSVYLNSHSRTDFGDVRFTDGDAVTSLSYWMESEVNSNYAVFWVKIPDDLSLNPATIYIYYGNPTATTTSNGPATFLMFRDVVADLQTQFGTASLTTYANGQDPGDGFTSGSSIGGVYASPCTWFRYYGGKQYQATSTYLYFEGYVNAGNYGTCGIDVRFRNNAAAAGWQPSNSYGADATVNGKHIVALDYYTTGGSGLNFFSTWLGNSDDYPTGTVAASYSLTATSRTTQEFTYAGTVAHTTIGYESSGNSLTLYHEYYAIAKYVNSEPTQGAWGSEQTQTA